jgi:hypothetical protein
MVAGRHSVTKAMNQEVVAFDTGNGVRTWLIAQVSLLRHSESRLWIALMLARLFVWQEDIFP